MENTQENVYQLAANRVALLRMFGYKGSESRKAVAALMDLARAESWSYRATVDALDDCYPEDSDDDNV